MRKDTPSQRRNYLRSVLERKEIVMAIVSDPISICYLTGFIPQRPGFTTSLVVLASGKDYLILGRSEQEFAKSFSDDILTFEDYDLNKQIVISPEFMSRTLASSLNRIKEDEGLASGRIGIEGWFLPQAAVAALKKVQGGLRTSSISSDLLSMRETKGKDEVAHISEASQRLDYAYSVAKTYCTSGREEIEIYSGLNQVFSNRYGYLAHVGGGYTSGERTLATGGSPTSRKIQDDDTVILDLQTMVSGYFSDTCRTFFVGTTTASQQSAFSTLVRAKAAAEELLRPGVTCKEVCRAITTELVKSGHKPVPHHAGHGIGLQVQEPPFFIPGSAEVLKEGVVCALEPGIYSVEIGGMRIEDNYLITKAGPQKLSRFPLQDD